MGIRRLRDYIRDQAIGRTLDPYARQELLIRDGTRTCALTASQDARVPILWTFTIEFGPSRSPRRTAPPLEAPRAAWSAQLFRNGVRVFVRAAASARMPPGCTGRAAHWT